MKTSYVHTLLQLLHADIKILLRGVVDNIINTIIWASTVIGVAAYLMPKFGLQEDYAYFVLATLCSSGGLFQMFSGASSLVSDFENNRLINFYLTLPMPAPLVWLRFMLSFALDSASVMLFIFPIGCLVLKGDFPFHQVNILSYMLIFVLISLFCGSFTLWMTSYIKEIREIRTAWTRFVYPLWFLGCFQFSWQVLYSWSPTLAYLNLCNPMTYLAEGMRAALLNSANSLNFWFCAAMIILFTFICMIHAYYRLKIRLDFV